MRAGTEKRATAPLRLVSIKTDRIERLRELERHREIEIPIERYREIEGDRKR